MTPTFWNVLAARFAKSEYTRPTLAQATGISIFRINKIFGYKGKPPQPERIRFYELQTICETLGLELSIAIKNAARQAK